MFRLNNNLKRAEPAVYPHHNHPTHVSYASSTTAQHGHDTGHSERDDRDRKTFLSPHRPPSMNQHKNGRTVNMGPPSVKSKNKTTKTLKTTNSIKLTQTPVDIAPELDGAELKKISPSNNSVTPVSDAVVMKKKDEVTSQILTTEEKNCLKSALAFVVLRRRLSMSIKEKKEEDALIISKINNQNNMLEHDVKITSETNTTTHTHSTHDSQQTKLLNGMFTSPSTGDSFSTSSPSHHRVSSSQTKVLQRSCSKHQPQPHSDKHILSMFHVAVSSASLFLYNNNDIKWWNATNSIDGDDDSFSFTIRPLVYNYSLEPQTNTFDDKSKNTSNNKMAVLDGLIVHIGTHLDMIVSKQKQLGQHQNNEDLYYNKHHSKKRKTTQPQSISSYLELDHHYSTHATLLGTLLYQTILKLCLPPTLAPNPNNTTSNSTKEEEEKKVINIQNILALCTVIHKLVLHKKDLGYIFTTCICKFLKMIYEDECFQQVTFVEDKDGEDEGDDEIYEKDCEKGRAEEEEAHPTLPELADVIVVNMLHLLEEISSIRLTNQLQQIQKDEYLNHSCKRKKNKEQSVAMIASSIITEIQNELQDIIIPIPINKVFDFYQSEWKTRKTNSSSSNGMDDDGEDEDEQEEEQEEQEVTGVVNADNNGNFTPNTTSNLVEQTQEATPLRKKKKTMVSVVSSTRAQTKVLVGLCPSGKMMLRFFLFDIVEKLSKYAVCLEDEEDEEDEEEEEEEEELGAFPQSQQQEYYEDSILY